MDTKYYASLEDYERFSDYLLNHKVYLDPENDFVSICKWLLLDPYALENTLIKELGTEGQELLNLLRWGDAKRLLLLHH